MLPLNMSDLANITVLDYQVLIPVILLLVAGAGSYRFIARTAKAWRLKRRFKRGAQGELSASKYLVKHGFEILGAQTDIKPKIWVDGEEVTFNIRADFLVSKNGRNGVVEVKTGSSAPNPKNSATRRQILEYSCYYGVDDVYLFDAEKMKLMEIKFEVRGSGSHKNNNFAIGVLAGSVITFSMNLLPLF